MPRNRLANRSSGHEQEPEDLPVAEPVEDARDGVRVVGVDVHAQRHVVADDEHGVAALLEPLGIHVADATPTWTLGVDREVDRAVDALLGEVGLGGRPRIVGLHIGAAFGPSKLWPVESFARLAAQLPPEFVARLHQWAGKKAEIGNADAAAEVAAELGAGEFRVAAIERKESKQKPLPPFITSPWFMPDRLSLPARPLRVSLPAPPFKIGRAHV